MTEYVYRCGVNSPSHDLRD